MAEAAARGLLALQHCDDCGRRQYPPRAFCSHCLSPRLSWQSHTAVDGAVLAETTLHHSHDPAFQPLLPLRVGLVRLACGNAVAFLDAASTVGAAVRVSARLDETGRTVLFAAVAP